FGEDFDGMENHTPRCALELFDAGNAAGKERVRTVGAFGGLPLLDQFFGDGLADIVKVFFVAEASGHPAAFHLGTGDLKAEALEKLDRDGGIAYGTLLAMGVVEDIGAGYEFANVKDGAWVARLRRKMARKKLHQVTCETLQADECLRG